MTFRVNQANIIAWQKWLNTTYPTNPANGWQPVDGFFTATSLGYEVTGTPVFNGNAGYPLKLFINLRTGEVKMFDARKFYVT